MMRFRPAGEKAVDSAAALTVYPKSSVAVGRMDEAADIAVAPAPADDEEGAPPPPAAPGAPYPLDTCPVSGEKLGADAKTVVLADMKDSTLNGSQVKFCCGKCEAAFKADPEKYVGKMNDAIAKAAPAYPLKKCLVMGKEDLGADAKTVVYQNRVYKLCCGKCVAKFKKDPAKFAKEYDAQVAAAKAPAAGGASDKK